MEWGQSPSKYFFGAGIFLIKTASVPIATNHITLKSISLFLVTNRHFVSMMAFEAHCLLINAYDLS
jgi:hypothetical protein